MQPELQPIRTGNSIPSQDYAVQQHRVLRNTYWLLAISLIPTAIGAAIGTNIDMGFLRASPMLSFFAILAIFYGWIFAIERNRNSSLGVGLLLGFTLFMGLLLGPLFQVVLGFKNGVQLVMMATGGTAAVFFGLAGLASSTTRDFSFLSKFLFVGFIVIMLGFLLQWPTLLTLLMFPALTFMYVRLAHREEREVRQRFGAAYDAYAAAVPGWFPRLRSAPHRMAE